jgi:hypothetical protein
LQLARSWTAVATVGQFRLRVGRAADTWEQEYRLPVLSSHAGRVASHQEDQQLVDLLPGWNQELHIIDGPQSPGGADAARPGGSLSHCNSWPSSSLVSRDDLIALVGALESKRGKEQRAVIQEDFRRGEIWRESPLLCHLGRVSTSHRHCCHSRSKRLR